MDNEALKAAMSKRRGQGVNLNIIIGGEENPEEMLKDVAPEVKDSPRPLMGDEPESAEEVKAEGPQDDEALFGRMLNDMGGQLPMANRLKKKVSDGQQDR